MWCSTIAGASEVLLLWYTPAALHASAALHRGADVEDLAHVAAAHEVGVVERLVRALEHLEGDVVRPAEREAVRRRIEEDGVVRRLNVSSDRVWEAHLSSELDLHRLPEGNGEAEVLALHRRAALRLRLLPLMLAQHPLELAVAPLLRVSHASSSQSRAQSS